MDPAEPEFLYVALVLPSLFAVTLIVEGLYKLLRQGSGWVSLGFGMIFWLIILGAYLLVLR